MKTIMVTLMVSAVLTASLAGCAPQGATIAPAAPQAVGTAIATVSSSPTGLPTPTPASTFRVDMTQAPQPGGQEPIMNNVTPFPTPNDPNLARLVQQARDDLAKRLGIPSDQIELFEYKSVQWPDGSLGCPTPGMEYTQVMVDGFLIRFLAQGKLFNYHGGGQRPPFLCENPSQELFP